MQQSNPTISYPTYYRNFMIVANEHGTFNVPTINCFSTPSVTSAMAAIDMHISADADRHAATRAASCNPLMEGTDKAAFLRWMREESMCVPQTNEEVNAICQRWIKRQIRNGR